MSRDEILDAAAQIFSQKGFHAASMQDIAEAVHLQKGSLYHHVNSKQEILVTLLDRALDMLIERMERVLVQPLSEDEKLCLAMETYLEGMLEHKELAAVLLLEHRNLDPKHAARHIPRRDRFEQLWRDLIQDGVDQQIFAQTDPAMTARALLGVLNWTITWYQPEGAYTPSQIASQFSDIFLCGLVRRAVPGNNQT